MTAMPAPGDTIATPWGSATVGEVFDHGRHWSARITYVQSKRTITYGFCLKDPAAADEELRR